MRRPRAPAASAPAASAPAASAPVASAPAASAPVAAKDVVRDFPSPEVIRRLEAQILSNARRFQQNSEAIQQISSELEAIKPNDELSKVHAEAVMTNDATIKNELSKIRAQMHHINGNTLKKLLSELSKISKTNDETKKELSEIRQEAGKTNDEQAEINTKAVKDNQQKMVILQQIQERLDFVEQNNRRMNQQIEDINSSVTKQAEMSREQGDVNQQLVATLNIISNITDELSAFRPQSQLSR